MNSFESSVHAQLITTRKYSGKSRLEVLVKDGVNHPDTDDNWQNDLETNERIDAWIHGSHLSDKKTLNDTLNNTHVDIGSDKNGQLVIMANSGSQLAMARSM